MNRLMIAGTSSGSGKTTVTCAVLSALKLKGKTASSFKCGPDYIDPMFHREISGIHSRNLDPYFCGGETLRAQIAKAEGEIAVIEGVMGYYDGIGMTDDASAYDVARKTGTPVVLVVNMSGVGNSAAAIIEGFLRHREHSGIHGVIFNFLNEKRYPAMEKLALDLGVIPLGFLPRDDGIAVKSRYLGLVTAGEIENVREMILRLGETALKTLDIDGLLRLGVTASYLESPQAPAESVKKRVKIAVARDKAFCFIYAENLELMEEAGAELVYFSPLNDGRLPDGIGGLYLPGGYPELYAKEISANTDMLKDVKGAVEGGMPVIAECGGFLYLHEAMGGFPAAGVIKGGAFKTSSLKRFGYVELTALSDNLICREGEKLRAHEFHYWDCDDPGNGFDARKAGDGARYSCIHSTKTLYAGFPHLYFPQNPEIARRFTKKAEEYACF